MDDIYKQFAKFMEDAQKIIDKHKGHFKDIQELQRIEKLESPK